jgi:RHS repeat-associated protein
MSAMSGPSMNFNKYRFSSKEWNDDAGLYYYDYRFYDANLQRWQNRDPLKDQVFFSQCVRNMSKGAFVQFRREKHIFPELSDSFSANSPINFVDPLGLSTASPDVQICFEGIHEFIGVDGQGYGFYPRRPTALNILYGPGRITYDNVSNADCHNVNLPCGSDASTFKNCVNNAIQNSMNNPPPYEIILFNCSSWAEGVIDSCNPNYSDPLPIPD